MAALSTPSTAPDPPTLPPPLHRPTHLASKQEEGVTESWGRWLRGWVHLGRPQPDQEGAGWTPALRPLRAAPRLVALLQLAGKCLTVGLGVVILSSQIWLQAGELLVRVQLAPL